MTPIYSKTYENKTVTIESTHNGMLLSLTQDEILVSRRIVSLSEAVQIIFNANLISSQENTSATAQMTENIYELLAANISFSTLEDTLLYGDFSSTSSFDVSHREFTQAYFILNVLDIYAGTPELTLKVEARTSQATGYLWTVIESLPITDVGLTILKISPYLAPVPNLVSQDFLPPWFRVSVVHADSQPVNYSLSVNYAK